MSVEVAAGVVLIVAPPWFNTNFALLTRRFDYPDIPRRPTAEILERLQGGCGGHSPNSELGVELPLRVCDGRERKVALESPPPLR